MKKTLLITAAAMLTAALSGAETAPQNILKNGGFEKHSAKWIDGWGRPSANCRIDNEVFHSGKAALKIGNVPESYTNLASVMGKIEDLKTDFIIRGWCKYEGVAQKNLPFLGIWTVTKAGRNSYCLPVFTFKPGNSDWVQFETLVKIDEFKAKVASYPEAQRPYSCAFRINLYKQPGTVWLDDAEIIPVDKK